MSKGGDAWEAMIAGDVPVPPESRQRHQELGRGFARFCHPVAGTEQAALQTRELAE